MRLGLSGEPVPSNLPYALPVTLASDDENFWPLVAYAVAWRETISGEVNGLWPNAATVISGDNGHGLMQLTSSWPGDWENPQSNCLYAIQNFLMPAVDYWNGDEGYTGDSLVKLVAASFNAGLGGAIAGHKEGDADKYTTDNYGSGVLAIYKSLVATGKPV